MLLFIFYVGVILLLASFFSVAVSFALGRSITPEKAFVIYSCVSLRYAFGSFRHGEFFLMRPFFSTIFFFFCFFLGRKGQNRVNAMFSHFCRNVGLPFDIGCSLCVVFICAGRFMILFLWEPQRKHWKCAGKSNTYVRKYRSLSFSPDLLTIPSYSRCTSAARENRSNDATAVNIECLRNQFFWLETIWKT